MTLARLQVAGSSLLITRLGFGCARILGGRETAATARLIEAALRHGIRHFDTAPSYGDGASETLLGDILAGVPDVTIATKVGAPPVPPTAASLPRQAYRRLVRPLLAQVPAVKRALVAAAAPRAAAPPPVVALSGDEVQRSLERSERHLRRQVDILLLHEPAQLALAPEVADVLAGLCTQGRIAAFGGGTGATLAPDWALGTVRQERFDAPPGPGTAILHGVLRAPRPGQSPGARLAAAMAARPDAAFLFSASIPAQIAQLLGDQPAA